MLMPKSASALTVVVWVVELFTGLGSKVLLLTETVLVITAVCAPDTHAVDTVCAAADSAH